MHSYAAKYVTNVNMAKIKYVTNVNMAEMRKSMAQSASPSFPEASDDDQSISIFDSTTLKLNFENVNML